MLRQSLDPDDYNYAIALEGDAGNRTTKMISEFLSLPIDQRQRFVEETITDELLKDSNWSAYKVIYDGMAFLNDPSPQLSDAYAQYLKDFKVYRAKQRDFSKIGGPNYFETLAKAKQVVVLRSGKVIEVLKGGKEKLAFEASQFIAGVEYLAAFDEHGKLQGHELRLYSNLRELLIRSSREFLAAKSTSKRLRMIEGFIQKHPSANWNEELVDAWEWLVKRPSKLSPKTCGAKDRRGELNLDRARSKSWARIQKKQLCPSRKNARPSV